MTCKNRTGWFFTASHLTASNSNKYAEAKSKGIRPGSLRDDITYRGTDTFANRSMPYHN